MLFHNSLIKLNDVLYSTLNNSDTFMEYFFCYSVKSLKPDQTIKLREVFVFSTHSCGSVREKTITNSFALP